MQRCSIRYETSFTIYIAVANTIVITITVNASVVGMKTVMTLQVRNATTTLLLIIPITIFLKCLGDVFA